MAAESVWEFNPTELRSHWRDYRVTFAIFDGADEWQGNSTLIISAAAPHHAEVIVRTDWIGSGSVLIIGKTELAEERRT